MILPCELIDDNGKVLREYVLRYAGQWGLGEAFADWVREENVFCSTLVDRIVTGHPEREERLLNQENGYEDRVSDTGEVFGFWAIEEPAWLGRSCKALPIL